MPYLRVENREYFEKLLNELNRVAIANGGELNFLFTQIINQFHVTHHKNYSAINEVVGAMECAKQEYYRRVAAPYEDTKIEANGDAYNQEALR